MLTCPRKTTTAVDVSVNMARCGTVCALLVALVSYVLYDTLKNGGAFRTLNYHGDAGCFLVDAGEALNLRRGCVVCVVSAT